MLLEFKLDNKLGIIFNILNFLMSVLKQFQVKDEINKPLSVYYFSLYSFSLKIFKLYLPYFFK